MAKRKRLEAPTPEALSEIEAEFRSETTRSALAPITQVAAESAALSQPMPAAERAETARLRTEAEAFAEVKQTGRMIEALPLNLIEPDALIRDRAAISEEEMTELRLSIAAHGLRLPIEVFEMAQPGSDGARYGVLSGYRRLLAVRALYQLTGKEQYATIKALIRPRAEADESFVLMVEENEIRANLSHFERGRIAVISAGQGAFVNTEEAVNRLFSSSSKAKRSKIRSFALIFEELGDVLQYPEHMSERQGLRLAGALRGGAEEVLRAALEEVPASPEEEWQRIEEVLSHLDKSARPDPARGGRPKAGGTRPVTGWDASKSVVTSAGISIKRRSEGRVHYLRIEELDPELMDSVMAHLQSLLDKP